ncbi:hypothetical protein Q9Q99_12445 [Curtobacterium flaccumfaciens]|nr:hypothetical protein Q9Q99_12445 [Curtobacterium flaccumfaciens]
MLQYSPLPAKEYMRPVLETTADDLVGPIEFSVYGSVNAVRQVLPGMRAIGHGTILFVNGGSAVRPGARVTGTSVAFAAESAYAQLLHDAVRDEDVHVGQLIIPFGIDDGQPEHSGESIADRLWAIHTGAATSAPTRRRCPSSRERHRVSRTRRVRGRDPSSSAHSLTDWRPVPTPPRASSPSSRWRWSSPSSTVPIPKASTTS